MGEIKQKTTKETKSFSKKLFGYNRGEALYKIPSIKRGGA